jgi:hypothetical protein
MRRVKYQSMDGDVMGVPHIQPLNMSAAVASASTVGSNKVVIHGVPNRASPARTLSCINSNKETEKKANGETVKVKANEESAKVNGGAVTKVTANGVAETKSKTNGLSVSFADPAASTVIVAPGVDSIVAPEVDSIIAKPPMGVKRAVKSQGSTSIEGHGVVEGHRVEGHLQGHRQLENGGGVCAGKMNGSLSRSKQVSPPRISKCDAHLSLPQNGCDYEETQL